MDKTDGKRRDFKSLDTMMGELGHRNRSIDIFKMFAAIDGSGLVCRFLGYGCGLFLGLSIIPMQLIVVICKSWQFEP